MHTTTITIKVYSISTSGAKVITVRSHEYFNCVIVVSPNDIFT